MDQKLYYLARLQISTIIKSDGGEYRAVAKNKNGQGTATINLNFEGGDKPKYEELKKKKHLFYILFLKYLRSFDTIILIIFIYLFYYYYYFSYE